MTYRKSNLNVFTDDFKGYNLFFADVLSDIPKKIHIIQTSLLQTVSLYLKHLSCECFSCVKHYR